MSEARSWIDFDNPRLSIREQCRLLGLHRNNVYYQPAPETAENLLLMRLMDEEHLLRPARGSRQMVDFLKDEGHTVNRKRIQRLMRKMGIESLAPKPRTTIPIEGHRVYPYLLRNLEIVRPSSGLVLRHHLHSDAVGVLLPCSRDGLVQSLRDLLAIVEQYGCRFLCGGFGGSVVERDARNFQYRSRLTVHQPRFYGTAAFSHRQMARTLPLAWTEKAAQSTT